MAKFELCWLRFRPAIFSGLLAMLLPGILTTAEVPIRPDANTIIQRSVEVLKRDWQAAPEYDYFERDLEHHEFRTYQVMMILGSPYRRLEAVDDTPLSPENRQKEQQKLESAIAQRCGESELQTEQRIQEFNNDRKRDHRMIQELANAFVFTLLDDQSLDGHMTWFLQAVPRPGYEPADKETKVLTGMQGKLWIDKATFQWVKVEASVIHPVSIEGFLAKAEPGTEFELEKAPVSGGVWLPEHFSVKSKAEILSFIGHKTHDEETYSNYQKATVVEVPHCSASLSSGSSDH
jgi:hypothetical protein